MKIIKEGSGWMGLFEITVFNKDGTHTTEVIKNRLTNAGLNLFRDALNGEVTDLETKYLALGRGSSPINDSDITLVDEGFRTPFVDVTKPQPGVIRKRALVLDNEAVFNIREIGIFAGQGATEGVDSGVMISRILYTRDKTSLESIQFIRIDEFRRG